MEVETAIVDERVAKVSKATIFLLIGAVATGALCVALHSHLHDAACTLRILALILGSLALLRVLNSAAIVFPSSIASVIHWIHALVFEILALFAVLALRISSYFIRYDQTVGKQDGIPILLVHGYFNTCSVWIYIRKYLVIQGFGPIYTLSLRRPFASIEEHAKTVGLKAEEIKRETGKTELVLIGHSMGGLVSAYYAQNNPVSKLIAIASPFRGTKLAKLAPGKNGREMERGSAMALRLSEPMAFPLYQIATKTDQLVLPYSSCITVADPTHQLILEDIGHASLLFSPRVAAQLKSWLVN